MKKRYFVIPITALTLSIASVATMATMVLTNTFGIDQKPATIQTVRAEVLPKGAPVESTKPNTIKIKTEEKAVPATQAPTQAPTEVATEATKAPEKKAAPANDADKIMAAAREAVAKCTNDGMTKEQKLKAAFDYIKNNYLEGSLRATYTGMDWPVVYATDLLIKGKGDCFSYGAAFAYMAKAIGYEEVYACNSGGHGWTEIDGKIYDAEWSMHSTKKTYFGLSYDEPCDVAYKGAVGWADWTRIKV